MAHQAVGIALARWGGLGKVTLCHGPRQIGGFVGFATELLEEAARNQPTHQHGQHQCHRTQAQQEGARLVIGTFCRLFCFRDLLLFVFNHGRHCRFIGTQNRTQLRTEERFGFGELVSHDQRNQGFLSVDIFGALFQNLRQQRLALGAGGHGGQKIGFFLDDFSRFRNDIDLALPVGGVLGEHHVAQGNGDGIDLAVHRGGGKYFGYLVTRNIVQPVVELVHGCHANGGNGQ